MARPLRIEFAAALYQVREVASRLRCAAERRSPGRRSDDAGRAVAAYVAVGRFGYSATEIAEHLGYRGPRRVSHAVRGVEQGPAALRTVVAQLEARLS